MFCNLGKEKKFFILNWTLPCQVWHRSTRIINFHPSAQRGLGEINWRISRYQQILKVYNILARGVPQTELSLYKMLIIHINNYKRIFKKLLLTHWNSRSERSQLKMKKFFHQNKNLKKLKQLLCSEVKNQLHFSSFTDIISCQILIFQCVFVLRCGKLKWDSWDCYISVSVKFHISWIQVRLQIQKILYKYQSKHGAITSSL